MQLVVHRVNRLAWLRNMLVAWWISLECETLRTRHNDVSGPVKLEVDRNVPALWTVSLLNLRTSCVRSSLTDGKKLK